jgi:hypothetical protein
VFPCELKKLLLLTRAWPISNDDELSHIEFPFSALDLTRQSSAAVSESRDRLSLKAF